MNEELKDARTFLIRGVIFFLIASLPITIQLFFPIDHFSYRSWEALKFNKLESDRPFYTDKYLEKTEEGDLAYRTEYAIKKNVTWQTDSYGFRNFPSDNLQYDVVIIGDSNIVGSGVSQEQTIVSVLGQKTSLRVYSFSSNSVNYDLNKLMSQKRFIDHPPKLVIVGSIERHIHELPPIDWNITAQEKSYTPAWVEKFIEEIDGLTKVSIVRYYIALAEESIMPRKLIFNNLTRMVFNKLALDSQKNNINCFDRSEQILKDYQGYLSKKGINFIFMPIPDKETIFYSDLPHPYEYFRKEPPFLKVLISSLKQDNIPVVDTLSAFKTNKDKVPFLLDDTHWSPSGINITADLLVKEIQSLGLL